MATLYNDIYDLALVELKDYRIDKIYNQSVGDFETYMRGFLAKAIPKFMNCQADLTDRDDTTKQFNVTLSDKEQDILSIWVGISWLNNAINDINQIQLHLNDTDFKHYAEGQNLKEKTAHRDKMREMVKQDEVDYGLKNTPWSSWISGNYGI